MAKPKYPLGVAWANQQAYDKIHGTAGRAGLEEQLRIAKSGKSPIARLSPDAIVKLQKQYDAAVAEYKQTQADKIIAEKEGKLNKRNKDRESLLTEYNTAKAEAESLKSIIASNPEAYDKAVAKVNSIIDGLKTPTSKPLPYMQDSKGIAPAAVDGAASGDVKSDIDKYMLTTDVATGAMHVVVATTVPNGPVAGTPVFFIPKTSVALVPGQSTANYEAFTSLDEARNAVIKQQGGDFTKLKQQLLDSRYISQTEFNNNDWAAGLNASIIASTKFNFNRVKNSGGKEDFVSFDTFLGSTSIAGPKVAKTGTTTSQDFSTRSQAETMLSKYYMSTFGQAPTDAEQEQFWTDLHTAETTSTQAIKSIRNSDGVLTNQQVTGAVLTEADRLVIAAKVGLGTMKKLGGDVTAFKKMLDTGSSVSQNINTLMGTANNQGIPMTELQAFKYVQDAMAPGSSIAAQQERINRLAIALHGKENKMVADHITAGGTYKDITDVYGGLKTQKTGVVVPDSTKDADVQEAVRLGMSQSDFLRKQQGTKAWRETPEAHNTAADFAETVLKSFGFIG